MGYQGNQSSDNRIADGFWSVLDTLSRYAAILGSVALLVGVGFLVYTFVMSSSAGAAAEQIQRNIQTFGTVAVIGSIAGSIAVTYRFWGEETLWALLLLVGAALFFAPYFLPTMVPDTGATAAAALGAIQVAGIPILGVGVVTLIGDAVFRIRVRAEEGTKADQLKYGKGLREEKDIRNVFMGKCWQLPYCRKFVRERCPIYHARRTCWKERVGCMCEESVIKNAMQGKVIPSDVVAASKFIPYNTRLLPEQKAERCRQCVIYNEHQKHKYKLSLPVSVLGLALVTLLLWTPLVGLMSGILRAADRVIAGATFQESQILTNTANLPIAEILLVAIMLVVLSYVLKILEFLFFKIKI